MERPSLLSRVLSTVVLSSFACLLLSQPFLAMAAADGPTIRDKAGVAGYPAVMITENLPERINAVYENIRWELLGAGTMAFMNAMQTFFGQLAYDAADYIASGGKGQSALYYDKGFEGYMKDVAGSAAGEFIGSLSEASFFRTIGFDLCRPPDPRTLLRIQLSLGGFLGAGVTQTAQRPQARCEFNDIIRNYDQVYQTLSNKEIISSVEANINTNSNDLGVSFLIFNRAANFVTSRQSNAEKDRKEGNGFQALRDMISGRVKTPAETIREEANQVLVKDPKASQEQVNSFIIEQAYNLGPQRLAVYTASVFLNTLASKLLKRVFEQGIDIGSLFKMRKMNFAQNPDELLERSREDARKANISLRTPNLFQDQAFDVLADMQACPENRGTWNCVVDEGLAQALRTEGDAGASTIQEALDRDYLHADWRLMPSTNLREEQDPLCYTYAYCSGNLRKLRLMRILPVGFEFAADSKENIDRCNSERGCITLGEVIKNFGRCNDRGERDEAHPWCRLIDPNWALTIMPQRCALSGFSDTMLSNKLSQRREECQDIQTCLRRNDKGECVGGYGYCVAEKTAYRFGAQECSQKFSSCRTYETRLGSQISYLRNSLDFATCSEDTVGCMWYSTARNTSGGAEEWIGTVENGERVYFDASMETCSAEQDGCTSVLAVPPETSALNLVANSSFERSNEGSMVLENWSPLTGDPSGYIRPTVDIGEPAVDGTNVAHFAGPFRSGYRQVLDIAPGRTMVLSGFVRQWKPNGGSEKLSIELIQYPSRVAAEARSGALSATATRQDYRSRECGVTTEGGVGPNAEPFYSTTDWARVQCAFVTNQSARAGEIVIRGGNMLVDDVMLEEGSVATAYIDGINGQLTQLYHKIAPDEFGCTGADTDHPSCARYAKVCKQSEANCDGYTDLSSNMPEVAAQLERGDLCPSACVGYAEYRKLASQFDLVRSTTVAQNDASEPVADYFIPATAEKCTQEAVGCEQFTVVDSAEQGGESTAAFSSLRFCELPGNDTDTYFTWEGSDTVGYQLRTWALKKRTAEKPGITPPEGIAIGVNAGPRIIVKSSGDLFSQKDPANCTEMSWRMGGDPDCRQFYNAGGAVFYRYYSQTVLSTNDCRQLRLAATNRDDCEKTGGVYNETANTCTYSAYTPESRACQASFAGCRAYAGAEAGNVREIFRANGQASSGVVQDTTTSSESLVVGDTSYRYDVRSRAATSPSITVPTTVSGLYRISFWMKATAPVVVGLTTVQIAEGDDHVVGTTNVSGEWKRVTLGLFSGEVGDRTRIEFRTVAGSAAATVFIDEIIVQQLRDVVFVKRGTWNTPAQCDQTIYEVPEPQAMLGCKQYQNRSGQSVSVRGFTRLCRPAAIGCREFIDTRNSSEPYQKVTRLTDVAGPSLTVSPADRYIYLVDDPERRCDAEGAMCKALGKPVFSKDRRTVERFETVYIKDDVRKYSEGLCKPSELFCEEYTTAVGREYFKDPQTHLCEYRERVNVAGVTGVLDGVYNGWFIKGESTPCYPEALASGQEFLLLKTGDRSPGEGYKGWGGACPVEESECTEFKDPNDKSGGSVTGRSYYFINDDRIDRRSCNNTVDPSRGCVLVRDMSSSVLRYSLEATLQAYSSNRLEPIAPVNCEESPNSPGCPRGRCVGTRVRMDRGTRVRMDRVSPGGLVQIARSEIQETETRSSYAGGQCGAVNDCEADAAPQRSVEVVSYLTAVGAESLPAWETRVEGLNCEVTLPGGGRTSVNDANMVVKVRMDRDCAQWLGCSSGETVYDPATNRYREICTQTALCDKASAQGGSTSFCANYVNRVGTSTEPVLVAGGYFDAHAYTARPVGIGGRDYSGYAIPNAFQVSDAKSSEVADHIHALFPQRQFDGLQTRRFTIPVRLPPLITEGTIRHRLPPTRLNQAELLPLNDPAYANFPANSTVALCRHRGTGQIGYYLVNEAIQQSNAVNCYFGFRGGAEAFNFRQLADQLSSTAPSDQNVTVDEAYPRALCRAYPEADAPFPTTVVESWDHLLNPPKPKQLQSGYENVNACAYGEDCSCSYKRVTYPGRTAPLFFGAYSQAVPPGICIGGPRDGESCVPSVIFDVGGASSTAAQAAASANLGCGPAAAGGRCAAFETAEIVRGVQGVCLEYDTSRPRGKLGDQRYPCLTWSPAPIIGGTNDPYRYVDTAGYFPPQNSGQYYCASPAKFPKSVDILPDHFTGLPHRIMRPGENSNFPKGGLAFDDDLVSDASELGSTGDKEGAYFNGQKPTGSLAANQCEETDDYQDNGVTGLINDLDKDDRAIRLVATGRGPQESYTETFYAVDQPTMNRLGIGTDSNVSFFEIKPFENPNGNGRLACGYNEDWVDGVHVSEYDELSQTGPADRQWRQGFFAEQDLQTLLTRGSERILTRRPSDTSALRMPCYSNRANNCVFKYWEGGYRASDKSQKFIYFTDQDGGASAVDFDQVLTPLTQECTADKPYYAIRAVFESDQTPADRSVRVPVQNVRGPWKFIGFWVSACGGRASSDNHFMYMYVRAMNADVCRELVEVRSVKTNQDAAFTDRVWRESKYSVPLLNISYGQTFAPYSSALNIGPAGTEPLFQVPGLMAGVSSAKTGSFLASGYSTYSDVGGLGTPSQKYAYLSNLFARIYRVYRYSDETVTINDRTCVDGAKKGRKCAPDDPNTISGPSVDCGRPTPMGNVAACDTSVVPQNTYVCNTLTGINAGTMVSMNSNNTVQNELVAVQACIGAPDLRSSTPRKLLGDCQLQPGWERASEGVAYRRGAGTNPVSRRDAAVLGAFRCSAGSVELSARTTSEDPVTHLRETGPIYCTGEAENTIECPIRVYGYCRGATDTSLGRCRDVAWIDEQGSHTVSETSIPCLTDKQCSYTEENFWKINFSLQARDNTWRVSEETQDPSDPARQTPYVDGRLGFVRSSVADIRLPSCKEEAEANESSDPNYACTLAFPQGSMIDRSRGSGITSDHHSNYFTPIILGSVHRSDVLAAYGRTVLSSPGAGDLSSEISNHSAMWQGRKVFPGFGASRYTTISLHRADELTVAYYPSATPVFNGRPANYGEPNGAGDVYNGTNLRGSALRLVDVGVCRSDSARPGATCTVPRAGQTQTLGSTTWTEDWNSCLTPNGSQPTGPVTYECAPVASGGVPASRCRLAGDQNTELTATEYQVMRNISPENRNENNDNNSCTVIAGYQPDSRLCPDPQREFCGLLAYDMRREGRNAATFAAATPLPTDVTLGHYTPSYLGSGQPDANFRYASYYTPRPPRIAAPPSSCPSGMSCGVQDLDRFSFNGVTEGVLNVVGGQQRSTIKFYGWAAHEQMAIRRLSVDWGDGTVERFDDIRMKNHKPFCGVQKECYAPGSGFTGLTCQSDTDCPLSAQACRPMGSCKNKPNVVCTQERDCQGDGSKDTCQIRTFFGNSDDACQPTPFEFSHAYACPANAVETFPDCRGQNFTNLDRSIANMIVPSGITAPSGDRDGTCFYGNDDSLVLGLMNSNRPACRRVEDCTAAANAVGGSGLRQVFCGPPSYSTPPILDPTTARCSGDTTRFCAVNADCAAGDRCIAGGIAPPGGCWDRVASACRFTPRVFLQDNWGWCTGECRSAVTGNQTVDAATSRIRHPYGGCYTPIPEGGTALDAVRPNTQEVVTPDAPSELLQRVVRENQGVECTLDGATGSLTNSGGRVTSSDLRRNYRPWVVFPGSLQLRPR